MVQPLQLKMSEYAGEELRSSKNNGTTQQDAGAFELMLSNQYQVQNDRLDTTDENRMDNNVDSQVASAAVNNEKPAAKTNEMPIADKKKTTRDAAAADQTGHTKSEPSAKTENKEKTAKIADKTSQTAAGSQKGIELKSNKEVVIDLRKLPEELSKKIDAVVKEHGKGELSTAEVKKEIAALIMGYLKNDPDAKQAVQMINDGKLLTIRGRSRDDAPQASVKMQTASNQLAFAPPQSKEQQKETNVTVTGQEKDAASTAKSGAITVSKTELTKKAVLSKKDETKNGDLGQQKEAKTELGKDAAVLNPKNDDRLKDAVKVFNDNKTEVFENITKQTKVVLNNGSMKFSTFVRPEELGRVDFKFDVKDGKVSGKIILQSKEAADIFKSNVEDLRAVFQKANVELDKLEITVAGRYNEAQGSSFAFSQNGGSREGSGQESRGGFFMERGGEMFEENMRPAEKSFDTGINVIA